MNIATVRIRATRRVPLLNPHARRAREIRRNLFAVLGAVAAMIPSRGDAGGHAAGVLTIAALAENTRLSRSKVRAALTHFQTWRVLWIKYQAGSVEIRFQRQVAVGLLAAQKVAPLEVRKLMAAHRRRREAVALFSRLDSKGLKMKQMLDNALGLCIVRSS